MRIAGGGVAIHTRRQRGFRVVWEVLAGNSPPVKGLMGWGSVAIGYF